MKGRISIKLNGMKIDNIEDVMIYIIAILIISSNSIYTYTANSVFNYALKTILSILPILFTIIILAKSNALNAYIFKKLLITLVLYYFIIGVYALFGGLKYNSNSFILRYAVFIPAMTVFFLVIEDRIKLFNAITNVMVVVSCVALFFWLFGTILSVIKPTGTYYTTFNRLYMRSYFNVYFDHAIDILRYRNIGIFGEAPSFCYSLCIAILGEFLFAKRNVIKLAILALAIITTFSTTGYLILGYLICIWCWEKLKYIKMKKNTKIILGIAAITIVAIVLILLATQSNKIGSLRLRIIDYVNGIRLWIQKPLVGYGYSRLSKAGITSVGYSNSLSLVLVEGGILWLAVYFIPIIAMLIKSYKSKNNALFYWTGAIVILFFISITGYTYFMLAWLAYGYSIIVKNEHKEVRQDDTKGRINKNIYNNT